MEIIIIQYKGYAKFLTFIVHSKTDR